MSSANAMATARGDRGGAVVNLPDLATRFVKRHPIGIGLWVFGLFLMLMAPAPTQVSPEMEAEYMDLMDRARKEFGADQSLAEQKVYDYTMKANNAYGWFLGPEERARYDRLLGRQHKAEQELRSIVAKRTAMENEARSKVGLWSEYGITAVRDKFWSMVSEGTGFAKRASWWDAFFLVLSGRTEEGIAGFLLRLLLNFCINFTVGMIGALVGFFWTLVGIVQSFNPDTVSAVLFFGVASLAAMSMIATLVGGLYGTVGGTVYYVAKTAHAAQLEGGAQRQRLRQNYGSGHPRYHHYHHD